VIQRYVEAWEMIKRDNNKQFIDFLEWQQKIGNFSAKSANRYKYYGRHLLEWAGETPLSKAAEIDPSFVTYLLKTQSEKTGKQFSHETFKKILGISSRFFKWAKQTYPSKYRHLPSIWEQTLVVPPEIRPTSKENIYVTIDEVINLIDGIHEDTELSLIRDKAAAAFLFVSGIRTGAFVTLPAKAIDLRKLFVKQHPNIGVQTKNGKIGTTHLLNLPPLIKAIEIWDEKVKELSNGEARWFSRLDSNWGKLTISEKVPGFNRGNILRRRLKILFKNAGLPYKSPQLFRRGFAVIGLRNSPSLAHFQAISQNLMHKNSNVTQIYYSQLDIATRGEYIAEIGENIKSSLAGKVEIPSNIDYELLSSTIADKLLAKIKASNYQQGSPFDALSLNPTLPISHNDAPFEESDDLEEPEESAHPLPIGDK